MMDVTVLELLLLAGLGAVLALDQDAGLGLHVSQPLVAAGLAGAILGRFEAGVAVGACLQLLWMTSQPVGGSRLPDLASASVAAVLALPPQWTRTPWLQQDLLAAPMLVGLVAAWGGGWLIRQQRRLHGELAQRRLQGIEAGSAREVAAVQHTAVLLHGLRGVCGVAALALVAPLLGQWLLHWGLRLSVARLAAGIGIVAVLRVGAGRWKWAVVLGFVLGFLPGVL